MYVSIGVSLVAVCVSDKWGSERQYRCKRFATITYIVHSPVVDCKGANVMSEDRLPDQATTDEVRRICKLDSTQRWQRFLAITRAIAQNIVAEKPDIWWRSVDFHKKEAITASIQSQLAQDNIHVEKIEFLVNWRMPKAIGSVKYTAKTAKYSNKVEQTPTMEQSAIEQELSSPAAERENSARPYDPVRDI